MFLYCGSKLTFRIVAVLLVCWFLMLTSSKKGGVMKYTSYICQRNHPFPKAHDLEGENLPVQRWDTTPS